MIVSFISIAGDPTEQKPAIDHSKTGSISARRSFAIARQFIEC
jgi:hypothetical protein